MDKREYLDGIKEKHAKYKSGETFWNISSDDVDWLIERAEKLQEIENYITNIYGHSRDRKRVEVVDELSSILYATLYIKEGEDS